MSEIGSLILRVKGDISDLTNALSKASNSTDDFGKFATNAGKAVGIAFVAVTAAAAGVATGLFALAKSSANVGDELHKTSEKTGVSAETLSGLRFAAELSDVSMQELGLSLGRLAKLQNDAAGGSQSARDTFRQLGLTFTEADGSLRPLNDIMLDAADRLAGMEDETKRAALAQELFGKTGINLLPLLNQGSAAIKAQMEEAKALGATWTNDAAKGAETFNDSLTRLGFVVEGFKNDVGQVLIPIINEAVDAMVKWIIENRAWIRENIQDSVRKLAGFVKDAVFWIRDASKAMHEFGKNATLIDVVIKAMQTLGTVIFTMWNIAIGMLMQFAQNITWLGTHLPGVLGGDKFQEHFDQLEVMIQKNKHTMNLWLEQWKLNMGLAEKSTAGHVEMFTDVTDRMGKSIGKVKKEMETFGAFTGLQQDAHVVDFLSAQYNELAGNIILVNNLTKLREDLAAGRAEEAVGHIIIAQTKQQIDLKQQIHDLEKKMATERLSETGRQVAAIQDEAATRIAKVQEFEAVQRQAILNQTTLVDATQEQELAAVKERWDATDKVVAQSVALQRQITEEASRKTAAIRDAEFTKAAELYDELVQATLTGEEAQIAAIERTAEKRRQQVFKTITDYQDQAAALINIETARVNAMNDLAAKQKSFWTEQQEAIKQSAAFTWSAIIQGFAGAINGMILGTSTFKDFMDNLWKQLLLSAITMFVQMTAAFLLEQVHQVAILMGFAAQRVAVQAAEETTRVGMTVASNAAFVAANTAGATATTSVWGGAGLALLGIFATIGGAFKALALSIVVTIKAVGTFVMGVLSSIAGALKATVFGIPVGIAILAGVVAIAIALAATGNIPGLKDGGMVTSPTMANIGEGGSAEAVIPLNDRGAKFMQSAMGSGSGVQHIHLYVDGRKVTESVVKHMPAVIHTKLGYT